MTEKQKPVAYLYLEPDNPHTRVHHDDVDVSQFPHDEWFPVFKSPPQRQWVGLTYPDREALRYQFADWNYPASLVSAIEAKLKEKNHGM